MSCQLALVHALLSSIFAVLGSTWAAADSVAVAAAASCGPCTAARCARCPWTVLVATTVVGVCVLLALKACPIAETKERRAQRSSRRRCGSRSDGERWQRACPSLTAACSPSRSGLSSAPSALPSAPRCSAHPDLQRPMQPLSTRQQQAGLRSSSRSQRALRLQRHCRSSIQIRRSCLRCCTRCCSISLCLLRMPLCDRGSTRCCWAPTLLVWNRASCPLSAQRLAESAPLNSDLASLHTCARAAPRIRRACNVSPASSSRITLLTQIQCACQ